MPQPLSKVKQNAKSLTWGSGAFNNRPDFAILAANIIVASSLIDHELGMALGRILKTDAHAALAIYATLQSANIQKGALNAAAKTELNSEQYEVFQAMLAATETAQAERHRIAHWLWGTCEELPDAMIAIDPKYLNEKSMEMEQFQRNPFAKKLDEEDLMKIYKLDYSKILVYNLSDMQRAQRDMNEASMIMFHFRMYLDPPFNRFPAEFRSQVSEFGTSESALLQLSNLRLFREARDRLNAREQKKQQSQPQ